MSEETAAFIAANKRSPVVSANAKGRGGEGGYYVLASGREFFLTPEQIEVCKPRWKGSRNG